MNEADEKFAQQAKKLFDHSVDGLDASTLSRLNRGRQAALAKLVMGNRRWSHWMLATATGVAAVVFVAVMVMRGPMAVDGIEIAVAATDMEILLGEESIDMLENLEFYSWLDIGERADGGDVS